MGAATSELVEILNREYRSFSSTFWIAFEKDYKAYTSRHSRRASVKVDKAGRRRYKQSIA